MHTYKDIAPELPPHVIKFIFGDVPSCLGLDLRSRRIATIAAVAILGTAHPELQFHIQSALNVGLIREANRGHSAAVCICRCPGCHHRETPKGRCLKCRDLFCSEEKSVAEQKESVAGRLHDVFSCIVDPEGDATR